MKFETATFIRFDSGNTLTYFQDFRWWKGIPNNVSFYPVEESDNGVQFIADGYGILKDNKYGLIGNYGNGSIHVYKNQFTESELKQLRELIIKLNQP